MKRILISGGAGFIGSHLVRFLADKGFCVTVLDNLSPQIHGVDPLKSSLLASINKKAVLIRGDVTSPDDWDNALRGQDAVIHLAAETGTGQSMYCIENYARTNIMGTALLADHIANKPHTIRKVIIASSRAIYGEGKYHCPEHGFVYPRQREIVDMQAGIYDPRCPNCNRVVCALPTDEQSEQYPKSLYAITKQTQEQIIMGVCRSLAIPTTSFRYQNVYGPGQSLSNPYTGILSIFSTRIRNGNPIEIFEDGHESRDFVYIDDVVRATTMGLESKSAAFQEFNVGTGKPIKVLDVAGSLYAQFGLPPQIEISGRFRVGDIRHNFADTEKIKRELGFEPQFDFQSGITNFCKWVSSQEPVIDRFEQSIQELHSRGLYK